MLCIVHTRTVQCFLSPVLTGVYCFLCSEYNTVVGVRWDLHVVLICISPVGGWDIKTLSCIHWPLALLLRSVCSGSFVHLWSGYVVFTGAESSCRSHSSVGEWLAEVLSSLKILFALFVVLQLCRASEITFISSAGSCCDVRCHPSPTQETCRAGVLCFCQVSFCVFICSLMP